MKKPANKKSSKTIKFPEKTKSFEKRHPEKKTPAAPTRIPTTGTTPAPGRPDLPLAATPQPQMMM